MDVSEVTIVTSKKLQAPSKRWSPDVIQLVPVIVTDHEFEERLAELAKIFYDELSQRPKKSQNLSLGMIPEVQSCELKRTGTDV